MKKFSTLVVAIFFGLSSVGIAHAADPVPPTGGKVAPVVGGGGVGAAGIPAGFILVGGVLVAVSVGLAIANSNNGDDSGSSNPTSTSTSTSTSTR